MAPSFLAQLISANSTTINSNGNGSNGSGAISFSTISNTMNASAVSTSSSRDKKLSATILRNGDLSTRALSAMTGPNLNSIGLPLTYSLSLGLTGQTKPILNSMSMSEESSNNKQSLLDTSIASTTSTLSPVASPSDLILVHDDKIQDFFQHIHKSEKIISIKELMSNNGVPSLSTVEKLELSSEQKEKAKTNVHANILCEMLAKRKNSSNIPEIETIKPQETVSIKKSAKKPTGALSFMVENRHQAVMEKDQEKTEQQNKANQPEALSLHEHPKYKKYFKMLKCGLPMGAVRHKMEMDQLDPSILELDPEKPYEEQCPVAFQEQPKGEAPNAAVDTAGIEVSEVPILSMEEHKKKYAKYFKMLKLGLTRGAVEHKIRSDGLDPELLDGPIQSKQKPKTTVLPSPNFNSEDEKKYVKYRQMLKIGLSRGAVEHKMRMDGLDPRYLIENDANASTSGHPPALTAPRRPDAIRKKLHWEIVPQLRRTASSPTGTSTDTLSSSDLTKHRTKSLWHTVQVESKMTSVTISTESKQELEKLFVKTVTTTTSTTSTRTEFSTNTCNKRKESDSSCLIFTAAGGGTSSSTKHHIFLVDMKKSQNIAITLARVKLSFKELKREILAMNPTVLSTSQLQTLIDMWPDQKEQDAIDSFHGNVQQLGRAEQFLIETRTIPRFKEKLICLVFKQEFPSRVHELRESIRLVIRGVHQICSSQALQKLFVYILQLGNFLNFGSDDDRATMVRGFALGSLVKLSQTKAFVGGITFLQYIIQSIHRDMPELARFYDEINLINRCSQVSISMLEQEKKNLDQSFKNLVIETQETFKQQQGIHKTEDTILAMSILKHFAAEVEGELQMLHQLMEELQQSKKTFFEYFEEKSTCSLDELLSILSTFTQDFQLEQRKIFEQKPRQSSSKDQTSTGSRNSSISVTSPTTKCA